jgi:secretion/DNA translocation related TadE-like protein
MAEATERGSGTVLMTVLITMAALSITVTLMLASATVARHRAGAIADLAALAGASASPGEPACDRAQLVADANAGRLVGCRILSDGSVVVCVELTDRRGLLGTARASARAGQPAQAGRFAHRVGRRNSGGSTGVAVLRTAGFGAVCTRSVRDWSA